MDIKINQLAITIPIQIGELSEKKKNALRSNLEAEDLLQYFFNPQIGHFFVSKNNDNFIINVDRISYTKTGNIKEKEFIIDTLKKIFDILMLDEGNFVIIDIRGNSETEDSFSKSKSIFNTRFDNTLDKYDEIYGVGYRFLFEDSERSGEYKIEPLLSSNRYYFHQYILNYNKKKLYIDDIVNIAKDSCDNINKLYLDIIKKME